VRLHEFEAKQLFAEQSIAIPFGERISTSPQAAAFAAIYDAPVVIKAQVLAGGRGKAGGILMANSPEEAQANAAKLLDTTIKGLKPVGLLVEERLSIARELYLGIAIDSVAGCPAVILSARGGVDIESVAAEEPEAITRFSVDPLAGLSAVTAQQIVDEAGLADIAHLPETILSLYTLFAEREALIAEINPLAVLEDGRLVAADAVLEIDDAARQTEWDCLERIADPRARKAKEKGMTYVQLKEGEVGLICSGAGLGMATMDLIADRARGDRGKPANFLETGGGITRELMASAMRLVLSQPGLKAVLINVYGGINPIHEGAKGVAEVLATEQSVPVVAKALGNHEEETWEILRQAGVEVVTDMATERVVEALFRRLSEEGK